MHLPPVVGMARSLVFFIPSMFPALGLHLFYKKRSSTYKPKNESLGMDVPPNTMESDSATTLVQDSTAIFAEDGLGRTPQRRSNGHASQLASANIKSMYRVDEGGVQVSGASGPKETSCWFSRSRGRQCWRSRLCPNNTYPE